MFILKRRFDEYITNGRFFLVEKAIAENDGEVEFFINTKESIWGTIKSSWAQRNTKYAGAESIKTVVPSIRFPSLIEKFGSPHYIKIDIEGADLLCLEGLLEFQVRPQFVSTELEDRHSLLKAIHLLNKLGYRRFKTIDQRLVPKQMPPSPAREGIYLPYHFDLGSSGLFGDELPGKWLPRHATMAQYYLLLARNRLLSRFSWYDLHAALPNS